jgi:hypothetical protein
MRHGRRWGLTAARRALAARQRQPRRAMPAAPGMPGTALSDPGHGGEGAGDGRAGIMPPPSGPGGGAGRSSGAGQVSHPARTRSRASTGTRCVHQRRMRDGGRPGQRGIWPASPVSVKDCRRPGSTTGTVSGRSWTATSPVPKTPHGTPAERSGKTGRSLASLPAQPVSLVLTHAGGTGLTFPYSVAGAREARQLRGTDRP